MGRLRFQCKEHLQRVQHPENDPVESYSGSGCEPTILVETNGGNSGRKLLRIVNPATLIGKQELLLKIRSDGMPDNAPLPTQKSTNTCDCAIIIGWLCVKCERIERLQEHDLSPKGCKEVRQVVRIERPFSRSGYVTRTEYRGKVSLMRVFHEERRILELTLIKTC